MSLKKDKQKVLGEFFDDDRIREFFNYPAPAGVNLDFHLLERAYRGMQLENFETFLRFYLQQGHDINATNRDARTLLDLVKTHTAFGDYAEALEAAGARPAADAGS